MKVVCLFSEKTQLSSGLEKKEKRKRQCPMLKGKPYVRLLQPSSPLLQQLTSAPAEVTEVHEVAIRKRKRDTAVFLVPCGHRFKNICPHPHFYCSLLVPAGQ